MNKMTPHEMTSNKMILTETLLVVNKGSPYYNILD